MSEIKCPCCGEFGTRVRDKRDRADGTIKRRRSCLSCDARWSTFEVHDDSADVAPVRYQKHLAGEGPHKLTLTPEQWQAIADGRMM